jgi:hypothetical protein
VDKPTIEEIQEQTRELTLAVTKILPRKTLIPAAMVRAFARLTAATIGAVADPAERAGCAVQVSELFIEELKGSLICLAERDGGGA